MVSAPSPPVRGASVPAIVESGATTVNPSPAATSRRHALGSVTTTWAAPAWRATSAVSTPIGPAP